MELRTSFKTKKALKEAVARGEVVYTSPGPYEGHTTSGQHRVFLEGPNSPQPHSWYAEAIVQDGKVVKVK